MLKKLNKMQHHLIVLHYSVCKISSKPEHHKLPKGQTYFRSIVLNVVPGVCNKQFKHRKRFYCFLDYCI